MGSLIAAKHAMRYLKGTIDMGLFYGRNNDYILYRYRHLDWASKATNMKRT